MDVLLRSRAGIRRCETEVRFDSLSVSVSVLVGQQAQQTLLNYYKNGITVSPCLHALAIEDLGPPLPGLRILLTALMHLTNSSPSCLQNST